MKAFVFGKFLPFHLGHQRMIEFASRQCQQLFVLVCSSETEPISCQIRTQWLQETFASNSKIKIIPFSYSEQNLPNTSVSSDSVSRKWSEAFQQLLPSVDAVITSEPYGEFVAKHMGISHITYNEVRDKTPISATEIRNDLSANWHFLPLAVKKSFQQKITILGTESVGKSTMAERLAQYFGGSLVKEAGRETIPSSQQFTQSDLEKTAILHAQWISEAQKEGKKMVFIDTDVHITQSYAHSTFGEYLGLSQETYALNKANMCLYLANDVPFEQDGTRLDIESRNLMDISHRNTLEYFQVNYQEVTGNWGERWEQAVRAVNNLKIEF